MTLPNARTITGMAELRMSRTIELRIIYSIRKTRTKQLDTIHSHTNIVIDQEIQEVLQTFNIEVLCGTGRNLLIKGVL